MKEKGFTLIELLVVIAIIAMLLAIIMPALGKAKSYAEEIICKNNLHQYQLVTEMYTLDHDDFLPFPEESIFAMPSVLQAAGEVSKPCRWHNPDFDLDAHPEFGGPLWPYLQTGDVSICPVFRKLAKRFENDHKGHNAAVKTGAITFSLSMNGYLQRRTGQLGSVQKSSVKSPSQVFLWAEENMWPLLNLSGNPLNDTTILPGADVFGSFHKISKAQLSLQMGNNSTAEPYNTGSCNILMVDGSLAIATPPETVDLAGEKMW